MIKKTQWSPDTCDCEIEYEWDTDVPAETRVHTAARMIKVCPEHEGTYDPGDDVKTKAGKIFTHMLENNHRKNKLLAKAAELYPEIMETVTEGDGSVTIKNIDFNWYWDDQRVLHVSSTKINSIPRRNAVQQWCDTNLGVGKVIVE